MSVRVPDGVELEQDGVFVVAVTFDGVREYSGRSVTTRGALSALRRNILRSADRNVATAAELNRRARVKNLAADRIARALAEVGS